MFRILGEQENLSQWDLDRKLLVLGPCDEVHISNDRKTALVLQPYELDGKTVVNVPNIFLQSDSPITAYAWIEDGDGGYTKCRRTFYVSSKAKPDDYVYTETEVLSFRSLDERVSKLETGLEEQVAAAVEDYMEQNPSEAPVKSVNGKTGEVKLTAEDVGAISQDDLQEATNEALAQAKASGEFDGAPGEPGPQGPSGNDYILTDADKTKIAEMTAELVEVPSGGGTTWTLSSEFVSTEEVAYIALTIPAEASEVYAYMTIPASSEYKSALYAKAWGSPKALSGGSGEIGLSNLSTIERTVSAWFFRFDDKVKAIQSLNYPYPVNGQHIQYGGKLADVDDNYFVLSTQYGAGMLPVGTAIYVYTR